MRRTLLAVLLAVAALAATGCQTPAEGPLQCDSAGCGGHVHAGERHELMDGAELFVQEILANTARVTIGDDTGEIVAGTTAEVGGLRVTVVAVSGPRARLLVTR